MRLKTQRQPIKILSYPIFNGINKDREVREQEAMEEEEQW
jgi:hypothetical protein